MLVIARGGGTAVDAARRDPHRHPPIYLQIAASSRKWKGVVRFGHGAQHAFLLVADRYPVSMPAFVSTRSPRLALRKKVTDRTNITRMIAADTRQ